MKDKDFDQIIREKLEGAGDTGDISGWDELEARMDAHNPGSDESFDELVFQKLHEYRAPTPPSNWSALVTELDRSGLRARILRVKLAELMVLLLILLPFTTSDPELPAARNNTPGAAAPPTREQVGRPAPTKDLTPEPDRTIARLEPVPSSQRDGIEASGPGPGTIQRSANTSTPVFQENRVPAAGKELSLPALENESMPARPTARLSGVELIQKRTFSLPAQPVRLQWVEASKTNRSTIHIGMYGTFNYNKVITPAQDDFEVPPISRHSPGYGTGISFSADAGRWELGGQLEFNAYSYKPHQIVYLEGSLLEGVYGGGVNEIELNTIGMGLGARYNILQSTNWKVFVGAGFQLNTVFEANYFLADFSSFLPDSPVRELPPQARSGTSAGSPQAFQDKEYTRGWFEGGSFNDNTFASGNMNAGAEFLLSRDWSLFGQAGYRPYLFSIGEGIGPDRDRIHSFTLQMGIRVNLLR